MVALIPTTIGVKSSGKVAWLDAPAAASYAAMRAAGMPAGGVTDAGRTFAEQTVMWAKYKAGKLRATAARPGTSKHESGRALDLWGAALAWVRAHGAAFGWVSDAVPGEPWHVEYRAAADRHDTDPTPEDDMPLSQADLEAIDRIVAGRIDERLRSGGGMGAVLSQAGLEAVDRLLVGRLDQRPWGAGSGSAATAGQVADEIARRLAL